jgi:thymidylate kinase
MADLPAIVCLVGGDASGKSTLVAALSAQMRQRARAVARIGIWDALSYPVVTSALPFADRDAVEAYLRTLSPRSRSHFMFHAMHIALDRAVAASPDVIIADAYWYEYFATEVAHGGDAAVMLAAASGFPEPARTFYLRDGFLDAAYDTLAVLDSLSDSLSWILLDGGADHAQSTRTMLDTLAEDGVV